MRYLPILLAASGLLWGQNATVTVRGITPQEAILDIQAPDTSACTIQVSDSADFSTIIPDVDPALFAGSDSCTRLGTRVSRSVYTFHVGARETGDAADGTLVSRSLQQATTYFAKVKFASGKTAQTQFTTEDKPLGDASPDSVAYDSHGYNGWAWPTIDYTPTGISKKYIDPRTGLQYQRMTGPGDAPFFQMTDQAFFATDVSSDHKWTLNGSLSNQMQAGDQGFTYTGSGGPQNALFLRLNWIPIPYSGHGYDSVTALDDILASFVGYHDPIDACLTYHHGHSCVGDPISIHWPTNASSTNLSWALTEQNFPQPVLSSWGNPHVTAEMMEGNQGSVVISGNSVTITGGANFPVEVLQPGDSIQFFSSNWTNWTQEYTIQSIQSPTKLTLTEAVTTVPPNTMYQLTNFGLMIWKTPQGSGTVSVVSAKYDINASHNFGSEDQGQGATGCNTPVSVSKDQNGQPLAKPSSGYICNFVDSGGDPIQKVWIPSTGQVWPIQMRSQVGSAAFNAATTDFYQYAANGFIQGCSYDIGNQTTACTPIQTQQTITQEIKAAHPEIDTSYYGEWYFHGAEYPFFVFTSQPQQNTAYWSCVIDVSKPLGASQVQSCHNSWSSYPLRWETSHSQKAEFTNNGYLEAYENFAMYLPNLPAAGQYTMNVVHVYSDGVKGTLATDASLSNSFYDPNTCTALLGGTVDTTTQQWLNELSSAKQCIQVDVASEPLNTNPPAVDLAPLGSYPIGSKPGPWGHNAKSCGGDGTTTNCWSYLQPLQPGDWLGDVANNQGEKFVVVKKTTLSNGQLRLVLGRNPSSFGDTNGTNAHGAGWTATVTPPLLFGGSCGAVGYTPLGKPLQWVFDTPMMWCAHQATWNVSGKEIHVGVNSPLPDSLGGWYSGYGVRYGSVPGVWGKGLQFSQQSQYMFDGSFNNPPMGFQQTHPGGDTWAAPPREQVWAVDGRPYGAAIGNNYATPLWNHRYSLVSGQASTYKITPPVDSNGNVIYQNSGSGPIWYANWDIKRRAVHAWSGFHNLQNVSGPNAKISDTTPYSRCYALAANQCVPGSSPGDMYVSVPNAQTDGTCYAGDGEINTPCATPAGPEMASYNQFAIDRPDPFGRWWRNLGMMGNGPGRQNNFANIHGQAFGDYGFTATNWGDGRRSDAFAIKLPSWPNYDAVQRDTFIPVQYTFTPTVAISVRARFGYLENGLNPRHLALFCSGEFHDECSTAVANSDSYAFASEPQKWQTCAAGVACTVTIPALPSRVLNYVIDQSLDGGKTWTSSDVKMTAIH